MKINFGLPVVNESFEEITGLTIFSVVKEMLGKHAGGDLDLVFDILYSFKKAQESETFIVELHPSQVDFIMGDLMAKNQMHFSFIKAYIKREIGNQKVLNKSEKATNSKK